VRHGRGPAARREAHLADLVLRHQGNVLADLAEGAGQDREPGAELAEPVPLGMPLRRISKAQPLGHCVGHRIAMSLEFGPCSDWTAELNDQQTRHELV